jgi:heat shock 70kDa protein 1/2/6/8
MRKKVEAKNGLENYCFQVKNSLDEEALKSKIDEEDQKKIVEAADEALKWLETNQTAEAEEFDAQKKDVEVRFFYFLVQNNSMRRRRMSR